MKTDKANSMLSIIQMQFSHLANRKKFAFCLITLEVVIFTMYGVFVRPQIHNDPNLNSIYYPSYQDVNVMMLIGFGFLMTFVRRYAWSALSYTFFINAIAVQIYILLSSFWQRIFQGDWSHKYIYLTEKSFTAASYSTASILIAFGAILGRVGPLQLLIMAVIQQIGYTLNQQIVYNVIKMYDAGGSTTIHTFGAYYGLTISYILGKNHAPLHKPRYTYISNIFAMIGTFFLWLYWPSFNAGYFPSTPYQRTVIITNTILALTGSNLACYLMTALMQQKFVIDHIQNATLAGGVIIGASSGIFTNSGASLIVGAFGGIVSSLGFSYLQDVIRNKFGVYDTAGVHNLHGIPGILGGIISSVAIAVYTSDPLNNMEQQNYLSFYSKTFNGRTFYAQGAIQIAGTFISLGMGVSFGIIAGLIINKVYTTYLPQQYFNDHYNFEDVQLLHEVGPKSNPNINLPTSMMLKTQTGL